MRRVGSFQLEQLVGRGGMGEVWRARHVDLGRRVAVKLIGGESLDAERVARFEDEVHAVAGLAHPGIVAVYDVGVLAEPAGHLPAGSPWLAMELARGDLGLEGPPARFGGARAILLGLLDALAHAHARGVLHRDLKPGNVLRAFDGSLRLTDFGIAAREGARVGGSGTPPWMAPEQFTGAPQGPWTDLYAVGCLGWWLVSGRPPFESDWAEAHHTWTVPDLRPRMAVPAGLEGWLSRCLAKHPSGRFGSAAEAAWALSALGSPTGAAPSAADVDPLELATLPGAMLEGPRSPVAVRVEAGPMPVPASWRAETPPPPAPMGLGASLLALRRPPLVGREAERDRLWSDVVTRAQGPAHIGLVGEPGVGTSALLDWLCVRVAEVGAAQVVRVEPGELVEALERATGSVRGGSRRDRLVGAVVALSLSGRRWLVALDGVDAESARAAAELYEVARIESAPLWVVQAGAEAATTLRLEPLPAPVLAAALRGALGLEAAQAEHLARAAGGHPGQAFRTAREWHERGLLVSTREGYVAAPGAPAVDADTTAFWTCRLAEVESEVPALQLLAVLGDTDLETWRGTCQRLGLRGDLGAALRRGWVRRGPGLVLASHGLAAVLREGAGPELYAAAADELEGRGAPSWEVAVFRAHAGQDARAVPVLVEPGLGRKVGHRTLELLDLARRCARRSGMRDEERLAGKLVAWHHARVGSLEDALAAADRVEDLGDLPARGFAVLCRAVACHTHRRPGRALEEARRAVQLGIELEDAWLEVTARAMVGNALLPLWRLAEHQAATPALIELAERHGMHDVVELAHHREADVAVKLRRFAEARALALPLVQAWKDRPRFWATACATVATSLLEEGDIAGAAACMDEVLGRLDGLGLRSEAVPMAIERVRIHRAAGELRQARDAAADAERRARLAAPSFLPGVWIEWGLVDRVERPADAEARFERALAVLGEHDVFRRSLALAGLAACAEPGGAAHALDELEQVVADFDALPFDVERSLRAMVEAGEPLAARARDLLGG